MASEKRQTRECPYCKEEILAEAIKCKHCGSAIPAETPEHKGICPYCKEQINPEAIKCKHCKSMLIPTGALEAGALGADCGCGEIESRIQAPPFDDQGQLEGMLAASRPVGQQELGFGGFEIKCYYLGPFFGRWCCLYFRGKWISCAEMRYQRFSS